jgi:4-amino-4-deoxy-L-arabinose transferase-like glycosyltransferase
VSENDRALPRSSAEPQKGLLWRDREWLVIMVVAVAVLMTRSWEGDLHGDPVRYAAIAKNMAATGDWLTLRDGPGTVYLNKPPLMFWLVALNFRLLGISTYTAKLWSCLFGIGACLLTFLVGRRLFGKTAGLLAGCVLATSAGFVPNAADLRLDSAVVFCAALAVYAVVRAVAEERGRWLLLAGLAGGMGMMTKPAAGLHVAVLTLLILGIRRPRMLVSPGMLGALALAALIAAPWHAVQLIRQGGRFADVYFGEQMGSRISVGSHVFGNLWTNVSVLLLRSLPWSPFAVYAVLRWRRIGVPQRAGLGLALLWIAEVVLLMAIPPKRYDRYAIPAYPAIALVAGCGLDMVLTEQLRRVVPRAALSVAGLWMFVMAIVPVPLHTYSSQGFSVARQLLDQAAPGTEIAYFDPQLPPGPGEDPRQWNVRSKAFYYLDRSLRNYGGTEELLASHDEFAIVHRRHRDFLARAGFRALLSLDGNYWLLQRKHEPTDGNLREPASRPDRAD